jgi:hypothetical protein
MNTVSHTKAVMQYLQYTKSLHRDEVKLANFSTSVYVGKNFIPKLGISTVACKSICPSIFKTTANQLFARQNNSVLPQLYKLHITLSLIPFSRCLLSQ